MWLSTNSVNVYPVLNFNYVFRVSHPAECFKCDKMGHIDSVCKTTLHFAKSNTKLCNSNPNNLGYLIII